MQLLLLHKLISMIGPPAHCWQSLTVSELTEPCCSYVAYVSTLWKSLPSLTMQALGLHFKLPIYNVYKCLFYRFLFIMALRNALCRLLVSPHRCAVLSASRSQGTAAQANWGTDNMRCLCFIVIVLRETVFYRFLLNINPFLVLHFHRSREDWEEA